MPVPEKQRILLVTRNLPPLRGGMERLNEHMLAELAAGFDVRVCCPGECVQALPPGVGASAAPLRPLRRFIIGSGLNVIRQARRFRPHLVLAGSGLTAPLALLGARLAGARSGAYLHGLDVVVEDRVYQSLWVPRFRKLDLVLVNSRNTAALAAKAGVDPGRIRVLHPGVELPGTAPEAGAIFRRAFGLGERPLLLALGRLTERKGLVELIEAAMPGLVARYPDLCLVVIGGEAVNALKGRGGQLERVRESIARHSLQAHVSLLGEQPDQVVRGAFAASSALVFPVLDLPGDVEGFGMVAVEAAAHGVPTVAFAVGGVVDAVAEPDTGYLVAPGDYAALADRLGECLGGAADRQAWHERCRAFAAGFEWERFGARLRALCMGQISGEPASPSGLSAFRA